MRGQQAADHAGRRSAFGIFLREGGKVWNRVRRETGKELMVRVHYDEGVAIHIGPEFMRGRS